MAGLLVCLGSAQAQTLADWTFERHSASPSDYSSLSYTPEVNNTNPLSGAVASATPLANTASSYAFPAGNGSASAFSAANWGVGGYFEFDLSTTGFSHLSLSFDQAGNSTGPAHFAVQYSTDGSTFTLLPGSSYSLSTTTFSAASNHPALTHTFDLSDIDALNDNAQVIFRVVDQDDTAIGTAGAPGGTVTTRGTSAIDNFIVSEAPTPEPSTILGGSLLLAATLWSRRRHLGTAVARLF